jgi:beta-N-acetylhexosaminidase
MNNRMPRLRSLSLLFFCTLLISCNEVEVDTRPRLVKAEAADAWADSIVKNLSPEEKAGQLLLLRVKDEKEVETAAELLRNNRAGGIILSTDMPNLESALRTLRSASPLPIWIASEIDDNWCERNNLPALSSLGACSEDSLLRQWGKIAAAKLSQSGCNLVFFSGTRLSPPGSQWQGSLSGLAMPLADKAIEIHRGLKEGGISVCEQPFPVASDLVFPKSENFPVLRRSVHSLMQREMQPACWLIAESPMAFQLAPILLTTTDPTTPVTASGKVIPSLFRDQLSFRGLIFSASLSDPLLTKWKSPDALALECLNAGVEVLMEPIDPDAAIEAIAASSQKSDGGRIILDARVKKVLVARARSVREALIASLQQKDTSYELEVLRRMVFSHSAIVLRNQNGVLPLGHFETAKVAAISIGPVSRTSFQQTIGNYLHSDFQMIAATSDSIQLWAKLPALAQKNLVIVSLHMKTPVDFISPQLSQFLVALSKRTKCVVAHFGPAATLAGLESLPCVIHHSETGDLAQRLTAELMMGAMQTHSRLPFDGSQSFCAGDGLNDDVVWRLRNDVLPEEAGLSSRHFQRIDSIVHAAIKMEAFPGCQVLVAKDSKIIYNKSFGFHDYSRKQRVSQSDLYDIASVTKMAATTLAVMLSYDRDSLKLESTLKDCIPGFDTTRLKDLRIEDLLIHEAGLPPALPVYYYYTVQDSADSIRTKYYSKTQSPEFNLKIADEFYFMSHGRDSVMHRAGKVKPWGRGKYEYSDMGFYLLKGAVEAIHHTRIDSFVNEHFYRPLGLHHITYNPTEKFSLDQICPTEDDKWFRRKLVHGYVHDQAAALLGGIGGHAGLFSNAGDLAVIMQMLINSGVYGGERYFKAETVDLFTSRHPECYRGLGFDHQTSTQEYTMVCSQASPDCFGHTGFTGTCVWADPEFDLVYIFLSNRVHPDAKNQKINIHGIRQAVQAVVYEAMGVESPAARAAKGGISSYLSQGDTVKSHINDTIVP